MKTITLRGIDDALSKKPKQLVAREGKSINQFILDTLKERLGLQKQKKYTQVHHDMDHLFGIWSENEFTRIQGKIDSERTIDAEHWR